jgi:hypothetical protein
MIMKNSITTLLLILLATNFTTAQFSGATNTPRETFGQRLYYGGNLGLQFGTQTVIDINPIVGYRINPKLSAGIGIKYQYYKYKNIGYTYETNIYGGSVFGRYNVFDGLFAYTEYAIINLEAFDTRKRTDVFSWFVGGGYAQPLGSRASMNIMILYNLTETRYTPYTNPIFRVGFGVGI